MKEEKKKTDKKEEPEAITFAEFLMNTPPMKTQIISDLCDLTFHPIQMNTPSVKLYCEDDSCEGNRFFDYHDHAGVISSSTYTHTLMFDYFCRHCKKSRKIYSIFAIGKNKGRNNQSFALIKLGEYPAFGPHIPKEVLKLIETDKEFFIKGLKAENQSLGIGAFSYYRRVVENQKNHLIDQIIKVSEKLKASQEIIDSLKKAKEMTQFDSAVKELKHAIPESLLIDGCHNPLNLLHRALSEGLHAKSDDACLELARDIRNVLTDLSQRLSQALKDDEALRKSVSRLLNHHKTKK